MIVPTAPRWIPSTPRLDAVIEEARKHARRRRASYAGLVLAVVGLAVALFLSFGPGGGGSPGGGGRASAPGGGGANTDLAPGSARFLTTVTLPRGAVPAAVRRAFARRRYSSAPPRVAGRLGGPSILWASPAYGGGWCQGFQQPRREFDRGSVSCVWPRPWMKGRIPLTIIGFRLLMGRVPEQSVRSLRLRLRDGRLIPVPTRDGFFLYQLGERVLAQTAPEALLAYDSHRRLVARELIPSEVMPAGFFGGLRRPPGGAELRHKHMVLRRATSLGPATIWAAPDWAAPARCTWLQVGGAVYGGSCHRIDPPRRGLSEAAPLRLPIKGKLLNLLWGRAGSRVAELSIRFQDGSETRLPVKNGVFLYTVPASRWRVGHRPAFLIARDASGRLLRRRLLYEFTLAR